MYVAPLDFTSLQTSAVADPIFHIKRLLHKKHEPIVGNKLREEFKPSKDTSEGICSEQRPGSRSLPGEGHSKFCWKGHSHLIAAVLL